MRTALLAALLALAACKKDEAPPPTTSPSADARLALSRAPDAALAAKPVDAAAAMAVDAAAAVDAGAVAEKPDAGAARKPKPPPAIDAGVAAVEPDAAPAGPAPGACHRTKFETKLVKDACASGGQAAAKTAMKQFVKTARATEPNIECKSCHEKAGGDYPLKDDGLDHFKKLGGE